MALFGQGDPRWRVKDRKDGKNVNAWHWTERNCTKWSQDKIKELFTNFVVCDVGNCKITEVSKNTGDVTYCNRKRKSMFFYELDITFKWEGKLEKVVKGEIKLSLSEDTPLDKTQVRVSVTTNGESSNQIKPAITEQATPKIREIFTTFFQELEKQFAEEATEFIPTETFEAVSVDQVPELSPARLSDPNLSHSGASSSSSAQQGQNSANNNNNNNNNSPAEKKPKISTKTFNSKLSFEAPPSELYECLLDSNRVSAFTQSEARITREEGAEFSLFGGQIHGVTTSLTPNSKIVQKWRFRDWPEGHYSIVTIMLEQGERGAKLILKQTGIPSSDYDRTVSGWNSHFWARIRATFGFNFKEL